MHLVVYGGFIELVDADGGVVDAEAQLVDGDIPMNLFKVNPFAVCCSDGSEETWYYLVFRRSVIIALVKSCEVWKEIFEQGGRCEPSSYERHYFPHDILISAFGMLLVQMAYIADEREGKREGIGKGLILRQVFWVEMLDASESIYFAQVCLLHFQCVSAFQTALQDEALDDGKGNGHLFFCIEDGECL